jgi:acetyl-CoA carboxylase biotin carboxyl carrier protein
VPEPLAAGVVPPESRRESAPARDPRLLEVSAPLLGIFYRAPRPGAAPYVEVGSQVEADSIIGIIEVMKLMNSVRAEVRGTVVEILAEDGAAVESGQVLLRVARGDGDG